MAREGAEQAETTVRTGRARATGGDSIPPSGGVVILTLVLVAVGVIAAVLAGKGDGFRPRVVTLDALAGITMGAFIVDRLLTFIPPAIARENAAQRAADLKLLRFGWGALFGAVFVSLTDLRIIQALTPETSIQIDAGLDRAIAVLTIAGGVAGLGRLLSGLNPQPATAADDATKAKKVTDSAVLSPGEQIPPPRPEVRAVGALGVVLAAVIALVFAGDKTGIDLVGPDKAADGTVALIVRFGPVIVAAIIVEQLIEAVARVATPLKNDKAVITGGLAVILGVVAARVFDLYVLHNIGFFGTGDSLADALGASTDRELWADTFFTGLVIAGGTKPIHDLGSRLRKAKTP